MSTKTKKPKIPRGMRRAKPGEQPDYWLDMDGMIEAHAAYQHKWIIRSDGTCGDYEPGTIFLIRRIAKKEGRK